MTSPRISMCHFSASVSIPCSVRQITPSIPSLAQHGRWTGACSHLFCPSNTVKSTLRQTRLLHAACYISSLHLLSPFTYRLWSFIFGSYVIPFFFFSFLYFWFECKAFFRLLARQCTS